MGRVRGADYRGEEIGTQGTYEVGGGAGVCREVAWRGPVMKWKGPGIQNEQHEVQ